MSVFQTSQAGPNLLVLW